MTNWKRIILTGQSGIDCQKAFEAFISRTPEFQGKEIHHYIKFEEVLLEEYKKHLQSNNIEALYQIKYQLLVEPYSLIYQLWCTAWDRIFSETKNIKKHIILNLHACWYHNETVEYFALHDINRLRNFCKNTNDTIVVTLIDDIYDVQMRLMRKDNILDDEKFNRPIEMILSGFRILEWRANELLISRHIAKEIGVNHYLFAVKHPLTTFYKLLFTDSIKCYLSHPISEVRRVEKVNKTKADAIKSAIEEISVSLSEKYCTFLPTTIDESRIAQKKIDNMLVSEYKLTDRWKEEYYNLHNHSTLFQPHVIPSDKRYFGSQSIEGNEFSGLLYALILTIGEQISIRDRKLVEQSDVLFVYRPCFNGNKSSGVLSEINYFNKISNQKPNSKRLCIIYFPKVDQEELKVTAINEKITLKLNSNKSELQFSDSCSHEIKRNWDNPSMLVETIKQVLLDNKQNLNEDWKAMNSDYRTKIQEIILQEIVKPAKYQYKSWIEEEYKSKATSGFFIEEDDLTSAQLISIIDNKKHHGQKKQ